MKFWKFWTIAVGGLMALLGGQYYFNLGQLLLDADSTYLTWLILGIGITQTICAALLWRKVTGGGNNVYWFFADVVLSIGMVGTLVGFLMVLGQAFTEIDTSSTESMTQAIATLASGMSTALVTSLVGLVTSIWLKLQLVILEG